MKIAIAGLGYVGLSMAVLLSQHNRVVAVDIDKEKVNALNNKKCLIADEEIKEFLLKKDLNLVATTEYSMAYKDAEIVIIATPTNYDTEQDCFDTSSIEAVIEQVIAVNHNAVIVIKSTVPVGYTESMRQKYQCDNILFSPEFLREGKALYDNLYPSRIIVGVPLDDFRLKAIAENFAFLLSEGAIKDNIEILFMNLSEAEAVKLFSNTYLALRVSFFNELDTYATVKNLDAKSIINGMGLDHRIGNHYNNPSFGYGGYCLPKDTKQLLSNYDGVPQNIISAVVEANDTRKNFIANQIIAKNPKVVGVYRLTMKAGADNFRHSAILDIIKILKEQGIKVIVYEPIIHDSSFCSSPVINDLEKFKQISDVIIANRYVGELVDVIGKLYTRDLFARD